MLHELDHPLRCILLVNGLAPIMACAATSGIGIPRRHSGHVVWAVPLDMITDSPERAGYSRSGKRPSTMPDIRLSKGRVQNGTPIVMLQVIPPRLYRLCLPHIAATARAVRSQLLTAEAFGHRREVQSLASGRCRPPVRLYRRR